MKGRIEMASIEFINKRIAGKEKEVEKLEKKLERIEKAKATGWEVNPYYYNDWDLKVTTSDLEIAKEVLAKYQEDLRVATEKANSRDVKVIVDFLEQWKAETKKYYLDNVEPYKEALQEYYKAENDLYEKRRGLQYRSDEYKALRKESDKLKDKFDGQWGWIASYMDCYHKNLEEDRLDRDLKNEADRKYDFIIERTNKIVGQITDASHLYVQNFELNGLIHGTNGTARVQTIGAGGWNIQRYHFRTLIHKA